ncbi:MAG: UDP-N-acetylmuramoyl-tripeptide--D-alanyl-D-alanine ligase [Rhodothermia bacterium]
MTAAIQILVVLVLVASGYRIWRRLRYFMHVFQLEGYKTHEFSSWLTGIGKRTILLKEHVAASILLFGFLALTTNNAGAWLVAVALAIWLIVLGSARKYRSDDAKKPLAFTPRMLRLTGTVTVLSLIVLVGAGSVVLVGFEWPAALLSALLVVDLVAPYAVLAGGKAAQPIETNIQNGFKHSAHQKLEASTDLTVIGITGSYGKTSVKFAVAEILSRRFSILATPGSYNTPMGISKVVNNNLRTSHQFLILEMGARYPGDIKELCEIARPDVAVLTTIGVAHLETMGSADAILQTKAELVEYMKEGGAVVANFDDDGVMRIARSAHGPVITASIRSPEADIVAGNISYDIEGCRFVVTMGAEREEMHSTLLGAHNVANILLGLGVGSLFGLRLRQMKHAVTRLRPIPHRLQLRQEGPITVIDDSFNSNPVGARNAVDILGRFRTGNRIIVTPGMVELGSSQDDENRKLGRFMAEHVDLAVLVGPSQTEPIREGLMAAGFREDSIMVCQSLFEARDLLQDRLLPGDVVLYENDLPDQYSEQAASSKQH